MWGKLGGSVAALCNIKGLVANKGRFGVDLIPDVEASIATFAPSGRVLANSFKPSRVVGNLPFFTSVPERSTIE
jgi:hypothetical protein